MVCPVEHGLTVVRYPGGNPEEALHTPHPLEVCSVLHHWQRPPIGLKNRLCLLNQLGF